MNLASWRPELRAGNKTPRTIETYLLAGEQLLDFLKDRNHSPDVTEIRRQDIRAFIGHVLLAGDLCVATPSPRHA
jgi:Phage integrase, N-terminal SAM-like domain